MAQNLPNCEPEDSDIRVSHEQIELRTERRTQFIDITNLVAESVRRSGITDGTVNVQTRHTTTAIVINENEPLLFEDLEALLEKWASSDVEYRHDDLGARQAPRMLEERINGYAHARAVLLGSVSSVNLVEGRLQLGRWQRILFVEQDGAQKRSISVTVIGLVRSDRPRRQESRPDDQTKFWGVR